LNFLLRPFAKGTTVLVMVMLAFAQSDATASFPATSSNVTEYRYTYDSVTGPWHPVPLTACLGWAAAYPGVYPGGNTVYITGMTGTACRYVPRYSSGVLGTEGSIGAGTRIAPASCPADSTLSEGQCTCTDDYQETATHTACERRPSPPQIVIPPESESSSGVPGDPRAQSCPAVPDGVKVGNPILPATGEKVLSQEDTAGAGPDALGLVRSYRSSWGGSTGRGLVVDAGLGRAWTHNHAVSIQREGAAGAAGSTATVTFGDGSVRAFAWQTGGSNWLAANSIDTLTANGPGLLYKRLDDDSAWQFDAAGRLLTVTRRNGWINTYTYGSSGTPQAYPAVPPSPDVTEYRYSHDGVAGPWDASPMTACFGWALAYPVVYPGGNTVKISGMTGSSCRYVPRYANGTLGSEGSIAATTRVIPGSCPAGSSLSGGSCTSNLLVKVSNQFGRSLSFAYNTARQLVSVTASGGQVTSYAYDGTAAASRLATVTYPGHVGGMVSKTYFYENTTYPQLLTGVVDELGNRLATYAYDGQGRGISTQHAGGAQLNTISYGAGTATVTDPLGTQRSYSYGTTKGKLAVTGADKPSGAGASSAASRVQDSNGFVTQETDFLGVTTMYTWDINRRLPLTTTQATTLPEARTTSTQWHASLRLPVLVTEAGRSTAYTYDSLGNMLTMTVADTTTSVARAAAWTYNPQGLVASQIANNIVTQTYAYYGSTNFSGTAPNEVGHTAGDLQSITNAVGHVRQFTLYDRAGRVKQMIDPKGVVTDTVYTPRGWVSSVTVTPPGGTGRTTSYSYDNSGQLTGVTLPDATTMSYSYDAAHRLTGVTDAKGNSVTYTLDNAGNKVGEQVKDPSGNLQGNISRVYDALNRVQQITGASH
jgi:YD repeat-containing protein